ncbi:hypothetical protein KY339_00630 [Candidatus Woesearchaeota archaeon]|nr:hypothetical protein [Candidatus Woesearchaeota archaeon]
MLRLKRGQITVFLIIAIVLLLIFSAFLLIRSYVVEKELEAEKPELLPYDIAAIRNYVDLCIGDTAVPGLFLLGAQGGFIYLDDPTKALVTNNSLINYGYLNGVNQLSLKLMEEDIAAYMKDALALCIDDFSAFQNMGVTIEEVGELEINPVITASDVLINVKYPLEIKSREEIFNIEDFSSRIPIRLGQIVSQANNIIEKHEENPAVLDLHYLTGFDTFITTFPFDDSTMIFSIYDEKSVVEEAPFSFLFAIKDTEVNEPPELDFISDFVLTEGLNFAYLVTASDPDNDALTFYSDSNIIPIDSETGLINVTPQTTGIYFVTFGVRDTLGQLDEQEIRFVVEG